MVKSKLIENDTLDFPKLMINRHEGVIVLMYSETAGTVVGNNGHCRSEIGFYSGSWISDHLNDYNGIVELSNEK